MSVLIKGMKMPENCHDCCLTDGWVCYPSLLKDIEQHDESKTKPDWCPLSEVQSWNEWLLLGRGGCGGSGGGKSNDD